MDRLVKPDVKEVNLIFTRGQKYCTATFRLSNLMHTMSVAVSLTTTNPSLFSFSQPLSLLPPLSTLPFTLSLSQPSDHDHPPLSTPPDTILVRTSMLPTGKAHQDDLRRLFSKPGPHVFKDATIPISLVGPHVIESLLSPPKTPETAFLLSKAIPWCDEPQLTSLLRSATVSGNSYIASALIDAGADINSTDSHGRTALHVASIRGLIEVIQFLVSVGGDAGAVDRYGWTPLHCAASEGHVEAVELLLKCLTLVKHAVTEKGKTAFDLAVEKGHSHLYDMLHLCDVLHRAARIDDVDGMRSCIAQGAKVNSRDQNGWTALHRAAFKGGIESVKLLLNHGAQVDLVDDAGYTPLHRAVDAGHVQVVICLNAHGARANVKSLKGVVVPFNLDCFKNHPSLVTPPLCQQKERA